MTFFEWRSNSQLELIDANIIIKKVTGYSSARLLSQLHEIIPGVYRNTLNKFRDRRIKGEPIAYILGHQEFYSRTFVTNSNVLIPRAETEHLIDYLVQNFDSSARLNIWDIGTGSGNVAITLKLERPNWNIFASDISQEAIQVAKNNSRLLGANIIFGLGSWFDVSPCFNKNFFDIIVSNPPYIKKDDDHLTIGDLRFEPQIALTDFNDGLSAYKILAMGASNFLKPQGYLYLEHGHNQAKKIQAILKKYLFEAINTYQDYANIDRVTIARKIQ